MSEENKEKTAWQFLECDPSESATKYAYKGCGLDDIYLLNGYDVVNTEHGVGVAVRDIDGLHRVIGENLVTKKKELLGKELRFLRKEMDLTQTELGRFIGLSSQQVARWEKQSVISQPADYLLRKLYLEHINGKVSLRELVEKLDDKDSVDDSGEHLFCASDGEWKSVAA